MFRILLFACAGVAASQVADGENCVLTCMGPLGPPLGGGGGRGTLGCSPSHAEVVAVLGPFLTLWRRWGFPGMAGRGGGLWLPTGRRDPGAVREYIGDGTDGSNYFGNPYAGVHNLVSVRWEIRSRVGGFEFQPSQFA
jgi:hypothetical protein